MTQNDMDKALLALCLWREARGEGYAGMRAVCHVIMNRSTAQQKTIGQIVTAKNQFSSMTFLGDSQTVAYPPINDPAFLDALNIVENPGDDPTLGALFYANLATATSSWFNTNIVQSPDHPQTAQIGHHTFFK